MVLYDSTTLSTVPQNAVAVACYRNGRYANEAEARWRFPHAHILPIAVSANADADCLDVETGDATPDEAPAWVRRQLARGVWRPVIYANLSTMPAVEQALANDGITRSAVRLWVAHYTFVEHNETGFDGTQWTDRALGRNLDQSLILDDFFAPAQQSGPHGQAHMLVTFDLATGDWTLHSLPGMVHWGSQSRRASVEIQLETGGPKHGTWRHAPLPFNAPPLG